MKFLFVLDSVEAPQAVNPQLGRRLAAQLAAMGHTVHLLELWDGETPPPAPPETVVLHTLAFADERRMNAALENGAQGGTPVALRLARLVAMPDAALAAFRQLVLKRPRRTVAAQKEIETLCRRYGFDAVAAVCAPYRAAFALEKARVSAKKLLWQLDPYAANREYRAPGGPAREARLLGAMHASFVTAQALPDYASGPLSAPELRAKVHTLAFPCLLRPEPPLYLEHRGVRCVFCGNLHPVIRSPAFALALLTELTLPDFTLLMAGGGWAPFAAQAARAAEKLGPRFERPGPVPPARARELLLGADVLLSLGNTVDNQLPSKVFEYIGTGKPILHLIENDNDPALPYLRRYPLAFCLRAADGPTPLAVAAVQVWLEQNAGRTLPFDTVAALYPEYTPAAVAQTFLQAL